MAMMDAFLHQSEGWDFVRSISDPTKRLLTELAVTIAYSTLARDPDYARTAADHPLDLLMFARAAHAFLAKTNLLRRVLDGDVTSIDELEPFAIND
jgi:hypothetical protein